MWKSKTSNIHSIHGAGFFYLDLVHTVNHTWNLPDIRTIMKQASLVKNAIHKHILNAEVQKDRQTPTNGPVLRRTTVIPKYSNICIYTYIEPKQDV